MQPINAKVWKLGFDEQLGNPSEWNSISRQLNIDSNGETVIYIPYQPQVGAHTGENVIHKPNGATANRAPTDIRYRIIKPSPESFHIPKSTYPHHHHQQQHQQSQQHQPQRQHHQQTTENHGSPGAHKFEEYLLHAQMPLPNGKTFVLSTIAEETDPEFLT